jgi:hypothetical protein
MERALAGNLWRRTTIYLRAEFAKQSGLSRRELAQHLRLSYVVAEFQARGLVHFHALIRVDGPDGPDGPAPDWADATFVEAAIRATVPTVTVRPRPEELNRHLGWGDQLDIRRVEADEGERRISEQAVSAYVAKYATKAAEVTSTVDHRIRRASDIPALAITEHARTMISTACTLGGQPEYRTAGALAQERGDGSAPGVG